MVLVYWCIGLLVYRCKVIPRSEFCVSSFRYTSPLMSKPTIHPVKQGLRAARVNLGPGLILQVMAILIVVGFYYWPDFRALLERVADLKTEYGFVFSMISTTVFAALIPTLVQQCRPAWRHMAPLRHLPYMLGVWAFKGLEIDLLYRAQGWMFGNDASPFTIACKTFFDMFIYCPLIAVPGMVLIYLFKDSGFSISATRRNLGEQWYRRRAWPLMIANWGVWLPAVVCIYALPAPLQLPIQNVVLCMWCLMLLFITNPQDEVTP